MRLKGLYLRVPDDGVAFDCPAMGRRHAGSCQGFPSIEGKKASASSSRRSGKPRPRAASNEALVQIPEGAKDASATAASRISADSQT
jgi:hypothetical protein